MQQTDKYKLNLIETSDPFSPAPLNENAQKLEAALSAEEAARTQADAALASRVTMLEAHKVLVGSYVGDDSRNRVIPMGGTPKLVLIRENGSNSFTILTENGPYCDSTGATPLVYITTGGIQTLYAILNGKNKTFYYVAIV